MNDGKPAASIEQPIRPEENCTMNTPDKPDSLPAGNAPSPVLDLKAFVPAQNYDLSKQFYLDLGFTLNWGSNEIAEFQIGAFRFLLQPFYVKEHAGNFMMSLMVEDTDAWWRHIEWIGLKAKYPTIMAQPPAMQPRGLRVLYLSDPTGVLWHIADRRSGEQP
jgi:Glyoxalase/Bleomycin resistance protein/Dioxygenase superfamily